MSRGSGATGSDPVCFGIFQKDLEFIFVLKMELLDLMILDLFGVDKKEVEELYMVVKQQELLLNKNMNLNINWVD